MPTSSFTIRVGYFVNIHPFFSQTFIRREMGALGSLGVNVIRYALRQPPEALVDADDISELDKTKYILRCGTFEFFWSIFISFKRHPFAAIRMLRLALKIGWRSERGILRHIAYAAEAAILAAWCERDRIQHLHAHFGTNSAAIAMLARELSGIPYSFTVHGPEEFEKSAFLSLDQKLMRASFAVCVSSFGKSQLMRLSKTDQWNKIALVRCGVGRDFFESPMPPPVSAHRLVCIGRLDKQKGQLVLIEAARLLREEGHDFQIVLGGDGPMRAEIEKAIERAGLDRHFVITGWISGEGVKAEIAAARCLIAPSFSEGLPVVIMEAMALGRPVISTYVAGIPELVEPEKTGWLVPAGDENSLAEAMRNVLVAPVEKLTAIGIAARSRVIERHNIFTEAAKLKRLFEAAALHKTFLKL